MGCKRDIHFCARTFCIEHAKSTLTKTVTRRPWAEIQQSYHYNIVQWTHPRRILSRCYLRSPLPIDSTRPAWLVHLPLVYGPHDAEPSISANWQMPNAISNVTLRAIPKAKWHTSTLVYVSFWGAGSSTPFSQVLNRGESSVVHGCDRRRTDAAKTGCYLPIT